jgi:hypothetical protein
MEGPRLGPLHLGLTAKNGEPFPVHILTVKKSELKSWDLCVFFLDLKASSKDKKSKNKDASCYGLQGCQNEGRI